MYKLSKNQNNFHCDETGLSYGTFRLVEKSIANNRFMPCQMDKLQKAGIAIPMTGLQAVANALNDNNLVRACIAALHLMPRLGNDFAVKLVKAGYQDDEPRDDHGRWATEGNNNDRDEPSSSTELKTNETTLIADEKTHDWYEARKQRFVDDHLADAQKIADQLHIPVENILGLSGSESTWGTSRFATVGNNFFSIYAAKNDLNSTQAIESNNRLKNYKDYAESAADFAKDSGHIINGVSDPYEFARNLQDAGKYGINPTNGHKVKDFVQRVGDTIVGLRLKIKNRDL